MESEQRMRPSKTLLLWCTLGVVMLAQGAASLQCYSCRDADDGGCGAKRIKIEECAPPRNVCLEAIHVVISDNQTMSAALKGCDVGTNYDFEVESSSENAYPLRHSRIHTCSQDLCNTLVTGNFSKHPDNDSRPSVPRDNECYSCLSTSEDQCSATKATVVKCHGDEEVCYNESSTITLGNMHTITVPYFIKKCSVVSCARSTISAVFLKHKIRGTCCRGNLCNGVQPPNPPTPPTPTTPLNTGVHPTTCVAHFIMAAILAITRI